MRLARLVPAIVLAACHGDPPGGRPAGGDAASGGSTSAVATSANAGAGSGGGAGASGDGGSGGVGLGAGGASRDAGGPCPDDMALVGAAVCMDRYEAPNQPGADPFVMESAVSAEAWCADHGKRLCTEDEWDDACAGPSAGVYPYGDVYDMTACNDQKTWKVVDEGALATWPSPEADAEVDALWQGEPSGSYPKCVSGYGVFDLTGNIEEWVVRTKPHANSYPHVLKGCYWAGCYGGSKPKCSSTNPAHADGFRYYETGFRCCRDAAPAR